MIEAQPASRKKILTPSHDERLRFAMEEDSGVGSMTLRGAVEIGDDNIVRSYAAFTDGRFNSHNERFRPGSFAQAIREGFEEPERSRIKVTWDHREPLALPLVMREDSTGLWTETEIPNEGGINDAKLLMMREGIVDGVSIEFRWLQSSFRYLEPGEYNEADLGNPVTIFTEPVEFDRVGLYGYGFVMHPSADDARLRAMQDIIKHVRGERPQVGWRASLDIPKEAKPMSETQTPTPTAADLEAFRKEREALQAEREAIKAEREEARKEREQAKAEREEARFQTFRTQLPEGRVIPLSDLSEPALRMLYSCQGKEGWSDFTGSLREEKVQEEKESKRSASESMWGQQMGSQGGNAPAATSFRTQADLHKWAKQEAGGDATKALEIYKKNRHKVQE